MVEQSPKAKMFFAPYKKRSEEDHRSVDYLPILLDRDLLLEIVNWFEFLDSVEQGLELRDGEQFQWTKHKHQTVAQILIHHHAKKKS